MKLEKTRTKKVISLGLLFAIVISLFTFVVAKADDNKDADSMSFYKASSNLSARFSDATSPGKKHETIPKQWDIVTSNPGNAGDLIGFVDPKFSLSIEWLYNKATGSSTALSYKNLAQVNDISGGDANLDGLLGYAQYGATLNSLGLSSTGGFMGNITSFVGGGLIWLLYMLASGVGGLFGIVLHILGILNPFRFFVGVSDQDMDGIEAGEHSPIEGITNFVGDWYGALLDMSWMIVIPLFIAFVFASILLTKKGKQMRGSKLKQLGVRILFVAIGIPILGVSYTAALNNFTENATGGGGADEIVLSNYLDFQDWAIRDNPLGLPDGKTVTAKWDPESASITASDNDIKEGVRRLALSINKAGKYSGVGSGDDLLNAKDINWSSSANALIGQKEFSTAEVIGNTSNLLTRYMTGDKVLAADYETYWKGKVAEAATGNNDDEEEGEAGVTPGGDDNGEADAQKGLMGRFDKFKKSKKMKDVSADQITGDAGTVSGTLLVQDNPIEVKSSKNANGSETLVFSGSGGLSGLSMYNFLNTDFRSNALTVYSTEQASSFSVRPVYNSVTQVGTGLMGFLYWFNALTLLGAYVVVGLFYALGMLFGSIKKSFQLMSAIPFATLGAIAGISKVIIYTVAMLLEILVTLFLYEIISTLILGLNGIIETSLANALPGVIQNNPFTGPTLGLIAVVISIISSIVFMIIAVRLRGMVMKGLNEASTKMINTFMETGVNAPASGSALGGMAKGAAAGAMLAPLANKGLKAGSEATGGDGPGGLGFDAKSGTDIVEGGSSGAVDGVDSPDGGGSPGGEGAPVGIAGVMGAIESGSSGNGDNVSDTAPLQISAGDSGDESATGGSISAADQDRSMGEQVMQNGLSSRGGSSSQTKAVKAGEIAKHGAETAVSGTKAVMSAKSGDVAGAIKHGKDAVQSGQKLKDDVKGESGKSSSSPVSSDKPKSGGSGMNPTVKRAMQDAAIGAVVGAATGSGASGAAAVGAVRGLQSGAKKTANVAKKVATNVQNNTAQQNAESESENLFVNEVGAKSFVQSRPTEAQMRQVIADAEEAQREAEVAQNGGAGM